MLTLSPRSLRYPSLVPARLCRLHRDPARSETHRPPLPFPPTTAFPPRAPPLVPPLRPACPIPGCFPLSIALPTAVSPFAQKPFKGALEGYLFWGVRRLAAQVPYFAPPFLVGYAVYSWGKEK
jgi:hypothetical protein